MLLTSTWPHFKLTPPPKSRSAPWGGGKIKKGSRLETFVSSFEAELGEGVGQRGFE